MRAPFTRSAGAAWLLAVALLLPVPARSHGEAAVHVEPPRAPAAARGEAASEELVAEAAFLIDTLPPAGHELSLSFSSAAGAAGEPDVSAARLQIALALGERLGVVGSAGVARENSPGAGPALDAPALSVKWLLLPPTARGIGLSASLDVLAAPGEPGGAELVAGVGALRQLGPVTARVALGLASTAGALDPHLHAGGSLAVAPLARLRVLAEAVGEWSTGGDDTSLAVGPTVKYALSAETSLAASVLLGVAPAVQPLAAVVQIARGL